MSDFRTDFADTVGKFVDISGQNYRQNEPWAPAIITKEQIDEEVERLASIALPENGRRSSLIVHPRANAQSPGLATSVQVTLNVLKPGERTEPFRHNATEVNFCIRGEGVANVGGRRIPFRQYDVYNTPSFVPYWRENTGTELQVFLTYTNVPLLQFMEVHHWEANPPLLAGLVHDDEDAINPRRNSPYGTFEIGDDGAMLMPYEKLINPPSVESNALHWPWERVETELKKLQDLGQDYVGRRLYLLYNPMTGRTKPRLFTIKAWVMYRPTRNKVAIACSTPIWSMTASSSDSTDFPRRSIRATAKRCTARSASDSRTALSGSTCSTAATQSSPNPSFLESRSCWCSSYRFSIKVATVSAPVSVRRSGSAFLRFSVISMNGARTSGWCPAHRKNSPK